MQYFIIRNEENTKTGEVVTALDDLQYALHMAQLLTQTPGTIAEYPGGDVTVVNENGEKVASYFIAGKKPAPVPPKKESEKINFAVLGFHKRNEWSDRYWG